MSILKGLMGMRPLQPRVMGRGLYEPVPEADLEAKLEHMKQIPARSEGPLSVRTATPLPEGVTPVGLRIDVLTHDGAQEGLPRLLDALGSQEVKASFYPSFGPDRSGLVAARLLRFGPRGAYSTRTLLSGTLLPSRPVAAAGANCLKQALAEGHEVGALGWDGRSWERAVTRKSAGWAAGQMERAFEACEGLQGSKPRSLASPGWLCTNESLLYQDNLPLEFASDCRGTDPFLPVIDVRILRIPQVPVTLPTLEEALAGSPHSTVQSFFDGILSEAQPGQWPVLAVSAEVEGLLFAADFGQFLSAARERGVWLMPLGQLLAHRVATGRPLPRCTLSYAAVDGRPGAVSMQMFEV